MLMLGRVKLRKVVLYKDADLDLDYRGITVIRGRNLNAKSARFKTNGAGKSLLTGAIPNCWFSSHPVLASLGKRASGMKAGMLLEKGSSITTEFTLPEGESVVPYSIVKYAKNASGSIGYTVHRDGKDIGLTTQTKAEQYIASLLPFTEEEFYTHTYLDARRPFLLRVGSPAQRAAFFSSMFRMDQYDYIHDSCHAMRADLGDEAIRLQELKRRASDIRKELDSIDYESVKSTLKIAEARSKSLRRKTRMIYDVLTDLKLWVANKDVITQVMALTDNTLSGESVRDAAKSLAKKIRKLDKRLDLLHDYEMFLDQRARAKAQRAKLVSKLGGDKRSTQDLRKAIRNSEDERRNLTGKIDRARRELSDAQSSLPKSLPKYNKEIATRAKKEYGGYKKAEQGLRKKIDTLQTQLGTTKRLMSMADDLSRGSDCALCGSDVSHKHGGSIAKTLHKQKKALSKRLSVAESTLDAISSAIEYVELKEKTVKLSRKIKQARVTIRDLNHRLDKLPNVDREHELLSVRQSLDELEVPKWSGPIPKGSSRKIQRRRDNLHRHSVRLKTVEPIADKLANVVRKYKGRDIEKLTSKMDSRYERMQRKMTKNSEDVARCDPIIKVWAKRTGEYNKVSAEIQDKEKALRDVPVLDMLKSIYGTKGLKRRKMLEYANFMESTMNRYADAIYHEKFRFKFDIGPNSFDIVAISGEGKKAQVRDVRVLSGAEGGAFAFLTLTSLLFMLPSRQRTNICVLDEMDFGMDTEGRNRLINSFIPELSKIVPHIIVVTPLPDEYPGSRSFLAVKDGDTTTLNPVQGHSD